jgi:hypothetical protein
MIFVQFSQATTFSFSSEKKTDLDIHQNQQFSSFTEGKRERGKKGILSWKGRERE